MLVLCICFSKAAETMTVRFSLEDLQNTACSTEEQGISPLSFPYKADFYRFSQFLLDGFFDSRVPETNFLSLLCLFGHPFPLNYQSLIFGGHFQYSERVKRSIFLCLFRGTVDKIPSANCEV